MFEEVPRTRRGLAGLTTRRVVLGPFVIGGGVLLAAVGGSVAVAATVITASTIHASDVPPSPAPRPTVAAVSPSAHRPVHHQPTTSSPAGRPSSRPSRITAAEPPLTSNSPSKALPASPSPATSTAGTPSTSRSVASPSETSSGPAGNAVIFVSGYEPAGQRLLFEFAVVNPGAGPGGSDTYRVDSPRQYSAVLASDLTVTSGGQLCPPAGSRCTSDQLIAAAGTGFFAIAAIDPTDQVHSIIEVDNVGSSFAPAPSPVATPTPSPSGP